MSLVVNSISIKFCWYCGVAGHACIGSFSLTLGNVWQSLADSHCWGGVFAGLYNLMLHKTKSQFTGILVPFWTLHIVAKEDSSVSCLYLFSWVPTQFKSVFGWRRDRTEGENLFLLGLERCIDDPILWSQKLRPLWSYFLNDFYNYGENTFWDHFLDDEFIYTSYFIF